MLDRRLDVCIGLKIGWTFGASITAAVLSFAFFRASPGCFRDRTAAKENLITATRDRRGNHGFGGRHDRLYPGPGDDPA